MKKALYVCAVLLFLITAGCEKQAAPKNQTPPPIPAAFTAKLDVKFGDISMTASLTKNASDDYTVQMLTPEIMSPLALAYKDGGCTVTYDGLNFETDLNRFPQSEFGGLLTSALSDIEHGIDIETMISEGTVTYKGNGERGIYTVKRNAENGAWLEFSAEGAQLHVVFSEYKTSQ